LDAILIERSGVSVSSRNFRVDLKDIMRQVNHMHSIGVYLLEIGGGAIAKTADFESSAGIETLKQGTPSQAISAKIQTGIDCVVEDKRKSP
jgi:6-phosphogluconate dehydrogenase (decarboxylating)